MMSGGNVSKSLVHFHCFQCKFQLNQRDSVRLLTEMARTSDNGPRGDAVAAQASNSTIEVASSSSSSHPLVAPVLFREIHKNGWLRRTDCKPGKEQNSRCWVTFCIHDDLEPRLEGFSDQRQATTHSPLWSQSLRTVLHLSPTLCATSKNDYEFCVSLADDKALRLAAPTYQGMMDWVETVSRKMRELKIIPEKDNLYSRPPERINNERRPSIRTRPLPPVPGNDSVNNSSESSYESVFLASSSYHQPQNSDISSRSNNNTSNSRSHSSSDESDQYAALIEYRSLDNAAESTSMTANSNSTIITPASSQIRQVRNQMAHQLTLRETQVLQLRKEMSHPAGVRLKLGRRDCKDGIAFVDCFGAVWIAGWKHKEHPLLYNVLHIGDLVLSIAGVPLNGASSVKDIIKNYTLPRVEMIVRRLPHGRVTTLTRRSESEDFGIEVGSYNEIISVSSTAQSLGLSVIANPADPSAEIGTTVGWTLTEVNNKPLNLFESSARERVNAFGRDLSIVLQPSDLVGAIKKKLRTVRSYKSFVLQ